MFQKKATLNTRGLKLVVCAPPPAVLYECAAVFALSYCVLLTTLLLNGSQPTNPATACNRRQHRSLTNLSKFNYLQQSVDSDALIVLGKKRLMAAYVNLGNTKKQQVALFSCIG